MKGKGGLALVIGMSPKKGGMKDEQDESADDEKDESPEAEDDALDLAAQAIKDEDWDAFKRAMKIAIEECVEKSGEGDYEEE